MLGFLKLIETTIEKDVLQIQQGSCIRRRFIKSECRHCLDACPTGALSLKENVVQWDSESCQECLSCIAACPTGALSRDDISFIDLLKSLDTVERPTIACTGKPATKGHARVPCLGILADRDLLVAISLALGKPVTLNMTACAQCKKASIIQSLRSAVQALPQEIQVELVFDQASLQFADRQCNRREFFTHVRRSSQQAATGIASKLQAEKEQSAYTKKRLPVSRALLLQVLTQLPKPQQAVAAKIYPKPNFNESCRHCNVCVGLCPTGALEKNSGDDTASPKVNAQLCVGCNLCEEFCLQSGVQVLAS